MSWSSILGNAVARAMSDSNGICQHMRSTSQTLDRSYPSHQGTPFDADNCHAHPTRHDSEHGPIRFRFTNKHCIS